MPIIKPIIKGSGGGGSSQPVSSGVPETLANSAAVLAVLSAQNVGKVYRYVGQDGNYDYNCYYIVEEVE